MKSVPRVHVVTDDRIIRQPQFLPTAATLTAHPIALHLRARRVTGVEMQTFVRELHAMGADGKVTVNDRVDVAVSMGVKRIHLPEAGLPPDLVKKEFGSDLVIGVSTHSPEAAVEAFQLGADYVFLGPIWPTASHPDRKLLGLRALEKAPNGRVIVIGGVTVERIKACVEAGVYGVAVLSAVWDAPDPASAALSMCSIFSR